MAAKWSPVVASTAEKPVQLKTTQTLSAEGIARAAKKVSAAAAVAVEHAQPTGQSHAYASLMHRLHVNVYINAWRLTGRCVAVCSAAAAGEHVAQ